MRPVLWGLLGLVVCLPLAFVLLIITAAKYPAMDSTTIKLPADIQTTVGDLIMQKVGYGKDSAKGIDRALRFDPENADAWTRRCHNNFDGTTPDPATCRKAIALQPTAWNFNGLGAAQEQAKRCRARPGTRSQAVVQRLHDRRQPGSFLSQIRELIEDEQRRHGAGSVRAGGSGHHLRSRSQRLLPAAEPERASRQTRPGRERVTEPAQRNRLGLFGGQVI